jgi:UDP-glucose 4-epimerase
MPDVKKKEKILITGASGFIGSFLVEEGIQQGYEVYAGVRSSSNKAFLQNKETQFFRIDISSQELMEKQLAVFNRNHGGFDYVIHNAGITRANHKSEFALVNAAFTKNLANALIATGSSLKKFIYISSMAACGPGDPINFSPIHLSGEDHPISAYAKSKLEAEKIISSARVLNPLVIRPTAVFGPRDKDFLNYFKMLSKGIEPVISSQKQLLSFIYVKDLAMALFKLLDKENVQTRYIASDGKNYGRNDMGTIIQELLNKRTMKIRLPYFLVGAPVFVLEKIYSFFGRMPFINSEKLKEITALNWSCDGSALWKEINASPSYTLEHAVKETFDWYKEMGWL